MVVSASRLGSNATFPAPIAENTVDFEGRPKDFWEISMPLVHDQTGSCFKGGSHNGVCDHKADDP